MRRAATTTATLLVVITVLIASVPCVVIASSDNRLGKWIQLDTVLQARMYKKLEAEYDVDAPRPAISVAWAYIQREVCVKGATTYLMHVKSKDRCDDAEHVRRSARRGCKVAGLAPGNLLLSNCTAALSGLCNAFFVAPGLPTAELCDVVGLTRFLPASRKADLHYEL